MAERTLQRLMEMNTKENLWIYILKILSERPAHAYSLRAEIEKTFGFRPGTVTAYRVLYSLKRKGFVTKTSHGRRKIYTITEKGRKELMEAARFYKKMARTLEAGI